jgi:EAL domain-containing protein (putative c-di-GMP-specific phosphodiesterase class I)
VNVGARQFAAGDLDRVVRDALQRHGVPARLLELELTESMLIDDPQAAVAMLTRLKGIGVTLSLDDFGTGYSSLGYLRQFPIDALKIDKCFVDEIEAGPDGGAIVDAVIALAHRLDLAVVAEGVETPQQRAYLERQGCDHLQGYLVGRPMPAELFEPLMAGSRGLARADAA